MNRFGSKRHALRSTGACRSPFWQGERNTSALSGPRRLTARTYCGEKRYK
jgi:hypothetical protein